MAWAWLVRVDVEAGSPDLQEVRGFGELAYDGEAVIEVERGDERTFHLVPAAGQRA